MWLECIRYRFRLNAGDNCFELAQVAALESLRNSPRCRSWRVLPVPTDPSRWILAIEWDPGATLAPFRSSEELADLQAALSRRVHALEESSYRAAPQLVDQLLGGREGLFRLTEEIVAGVVLEPALGRHFQSDDGSRRARLSLWLVAALGGPDLFSSSFPESLVSEGPLLDARLDLDERARLLEVAERVLADSSEARARCVLDALRAHLPLHPFPVSQRLAEASDFDEPTVILEPARILPQAQHTIGPAAPESERRALEAEPSSPDLALPLAR